MRSNSSSRHKTRIGVDIGGTFTDVVVVDPGGTVSARKVSSTPQDYAEGVLHGIRAAVGELPLELSEPAEIIHATTIATNAILERKGPRCGLLTTKGFRDVLEIGRLRMPKLYNIFYEKRPPLVPRFLRQEVNERVGPKGEVLRSLDLQGAVDAIQTLANSQVKSVAICLLNSFANSMHEEELAKLVQSLAPNIAVSLSSKVLPEIGEFERTSTTVINAYLLRVLGSYLDSLLRRLRHENYTGPLFMLQSGGGMIGIKAAQEQPVRLVESGPAAGVIATC